MSVQYNVSGTLLRLVQQSPIGSLNLDVEGKVRKISRAVVLPSYCSDGRKYCRCEGPN